MTDSVGDPVATAAPPRLGRYELLGEIASGGMATVYLGRALGAKGFARLVAIKRLHPHLEHDEEFVAMFLDEARLAARIRHPNVVATLDVEDREGLYLVMEYVEGDRVAGLIREMARGRVGVPARVALKIAIDALEGLQAAHDMADDDGRPLRLIHRDVSPQNVLVGVDGVTRITDFGIAKAESRATHTRDGQLKGKLSYMAPEQMSHPDAIDHRVDLFAMGIVTWEMLTGRRLFRGESDAETIGAVMNREVPPLRVMVPSIPAAVDAAVLGALVRDPAQRYPDARAFAAALERAGASLPGGIAPPREIADYVRTTAGPKLERERARLRSGWTGEPSPRADDAHPMTPSGLSSSGPRSVTASGSRGGRVSDAGLRARAESVSETPPPTALPAPPVRLGDESGTASGAVALPNGRAGRGSRTLVPALLGVGAVCLLAAVALVTVRGRSGGSREAAGGAASSTGGAASSAGGVHAAGAPEAPRVELPAQANGAPGTAIGASAADAASAENDAGAATARSGSANGASESGANGRTPRHRDRANGASGRSGSGRVDDSEFIGNNPYRR